MKNDKEILIDVYILQKRSDSRNNKILHKMGIHTPSANNTVHTCMLCSLCISTNNYACVSFTVNQNGVDDAPSDLLNINADDFNLRSIKDWFNKLSLAKW